ncbi:hypothetical protein C0J52_11541 [Blattella germanica]|nr:hypothetical protein C0J52_11541 [Blattella germanica]
MWSRISRRGQTYLAESAQMTQTDPEPTKTLESTFITTIISDLWQNLQRSLTIEEILTELELLDSTQVEDIDRFDITILPPDPEYDTDVDDVQDKVKYREVVIPL